MSKWHCTACATLVSGGFPFEEKAIGGIGPRTCTKCKVTKDRADGMHLLASQIKCGCATCSPQDFPSPRMIVCQTCENKRCPKATSHDNACTNSNEFGQPGSGYSKIEP